MAECKPCGRRMTGVYNAAPGSRKKEWRVFFDAGPTREYYTEADADAALEKYGPGRKQKLAR